MTPELTTALAGLIVAVTALVYAWVGLLKAKAAAQANADNHADLAQRVSNIETKSSIGELPTFAQTKSFPASVPTDQNKPTG
jgi:hypothetical protein